MSPAPAIEGTCSLDGITCCSEPPMATADRAAWWRIGLGACSPSTA